MSNKGYLSKTISISKVSSPTRETREAIGCLSGQYKHHQRETLEEVIQFMAQENNTPQQEAIREYEKLLSSEKIFSEEFSSQYKKSLEKQLKGSISVRDPLLDKSIGEGFSHLVNLIIDAQKHTDREPRVRKALAELRTLLDNYFNLMYNINKTTKGAASPTTSERPVLSRVKSRDMVEDKPIPKEERKKKPIDPFAISIESTFIPVPRTEYQRMVRLLDSQEMEIEELSSRLSRIASDKLTQGNPNIVDLSDKNRPTKIGENFGSLYDDEWSDAFEAFKTIHGDDDDQCIFDLMRIVRKALPFCQNVANRQLEKLVTSMQEPMINVEMSLETQHRMLSIGRKSPESDRLHKISDKHAKLYRKECAFESVAGLVKLFKESELTVQFNWAKTKYPNEIETYIDKCLQLTWLMCVQDPPMALKWPEKGDKMDKDMYSYYGKKGKVVELVVWPAVLLYENGPLISKGYVQPQ